jgi:putative ABC transport system ATP-binding protein
MIEIRNVTKRFGPPPGASEPVCARINALDGINLSIDENQVIAIKGPNGSGKTTLLTLIGGMARPTSGRIFIDEQEITGLSEKFLSQLRRERFGFIFQDYNLIRGVSVIENVMVPAYPTGRSPGEIRNNALALLEKMEIAGKAGQKVERLSGGEQQKVAIARAMINNPRIIIADEPTSHLHSDAIDQFLHTVTGLVAEGRCVILSTHNPYLVDSDIIDRCIELKDGRVVGDRSRQH